MPAHALRAVLLTALLIACDDDPHSAPRADAAPEPAVPEAGPPDTAVVEAASAPIDVGAPEPVDTAAPDDLAAPDTADPAPDAPVEAAPPIPDAAPEVVPETSPFPPGALFLLSRPGGTFTGPLALTITSAGPAIAITYTLDGSLPTPASTPYTAPIAIDKPTVLRVLARSTSAEELRTEVFVPLAPALAATTSNLPVLFLHALAAPEPPPTSFANIPGALVITRPGQPLDGAADAAHWIGWKVRGRTSRLSPQRGFAIELWDRSPADDLDRPLLGLPAQSDWVLTGPAYWDRSLLRNAFIYALSNRIGRYAARTRFVEVHVAGAGQAFDASTYRGVYTFTEKLKRDPQRIPIARLRPNDVTEPAVTGGYIFKIDDNFVDGEVPFIAGGHQMELVTPDSADLVPAQASYLRSYLDGMVAALNGPGGVEPATGRHYSDYLDVASFIDFHILNVFAKNADALRLSAYYHKDRGGKLHAGPIWDFDRALGSQDPRVMAPQGWSADPQGDVFRYGWWGPLFRDPAFEARYWARWEELLATHLRTDVLHALVADQAAMIGEAQARHFSRWPEWAPAFGYAGELYRLLTWLDGRVAWVTANLRKR